MKAKFSAPVWIYDGGLTFTSILNPEEASDYLRGWRGPKAPVYDEAVRAMQAAGRGKMDAVLARHTFRRFAAREDCLTLTWINAFRPDGSGRTMCLTRVDWPVTTQWVGGPGRESRLSGASRLFLSRR
jgi:hypothetical protein